jgi:hypothetical protein
MSGEANTVTQCRYFAGFAPTSTKGAKEFPISQILEANVKNDVRIVLNDCHTLLSIIREMQIEAERRM